jgi:gas vesicle protein
VSSAIAGLIGAAIGALAGVAGALISQPMQARATQERAFQSKKEEAYSSTLRYLLRVQNRRSGAAPEQGFTYITKEWIKELFDDMVEAQSWASSLTIYCSESQRETVKRVSHDLNEVVAHYASGALPQEANEGMSEFRNFYETILACAREDIGESYVG